MKYISVCSGIEAASVAWQPLGWEAVAFAEIEAFPNAVLAYRFPSVPNLGDISKVDWSKYHGTVDLVVGGTPCQSFSVAGKREGMDGASGLVREYFRLLSECKPKWFVWENVPGVVSSNGGADWLFILREWHKLGYHVAFRVLDAQYAGVPQRRRRIFAVGCLGDWRPPAKVLFEQYSLSRHPAPSRKARQADPGNSAVGTYAAGSYGGYEPGCGTLRAAGGDLGGGRETLIAGCVSSKWAKGTGGPAGDECYNLVCTQYGDKAGALRARYNSSPCVDNGQNIIFEPGAMSRIGGYVYDDIAPTLRAEPGDNLPAVCPVAFKVRQGKDGGEKGFLGSEDQAFTLATTQDQSLFSNAAVRRLTPIECERLQGFPDGWTDIPYKGKPAPDGARYRALGNSMAVPCMAWIGKRIQMVEEGEL